MVTQVTVDLGRGTLEDPEGPDDREGHRLIADVEVVQRARRLRFSQYRSVGTSISPMLSLSVR